MRIYLKITFIPHNLTTFIFWSHPLLDIFDILCYRCSLYLFLPLQAFMLENTKSKPGYLWEKSQTCTWILLMVSLVWFDIIMTTHAYIPLRSGQHHPTQKICIDRVNAEWEGVQQEVPGNHAQDGSQEVIRHHVQQNFRQNFWYGH